MEDLSYADIRSAVDSGGFGGDNAWVMLILFALIFGWGGNGFNGRGGEQYATSADVQRATDFAALERQNNEIMQNTSNVGAGIISALKDGNYNSLSELRDIEQSMATGFANQQTCCCETNRNIDSVRYDLSKFACETEKAVHAEGEATRALIQQDKIDTLQQQLNQLYIQQATCGVVRYPSASTYNAGYSPFSGGCCGNI